MKFIRRYTAATEPQEKEEPVDRNLIKALIEADDLENKGTYEDVKGMILPYITNDPYYFEARAASENCAPGSSGGYGPKDFPSHEWNGLSIAYMMCWGLLYPGVRIEHIVKKDHMERFQVNEETLFQDAVGNLKRLVENRTYTFDAQKGSPYLSIILLDEPFQFYDYACSVILLDDFYEGIYKEVGGSYYLMPLWRDRFTIVPKEWAIKNNGIWTLHSLLSTDIEADGSRMVDTILFYDSPGSKPVLVPDRRMVKL